MLEASPRVDVSSDPVTPAPRRTGPADPVPTVPTVPKISLGLPVYNGENYLAETLDSILAQTLADFELIISDNASTDATAEICRAYAARDPRIRYFRQPHNLGAAANYDFVFHQARGAYFKWCAHDDLLGETLLAACADWLDRHDAYVGAYPADVIRFDQQTGARRSDNPDLDPGPAGPGARFRHYIRLGSIHCGVFFALYRTDAVKGSGLHGAFIGSDRVFIGEMLLRGRIARVDGARLTFREHPDQYSRRELHNEDDAIAWMDPDKSGIRTMARARLVREYVRAIGRGALSTGDRLVATWTLGGLVWTQRSRLLKELLFPFYRNGRATETGLSVLKVTGIRR